MCLLSYICFFYVFVFLLGNMAQYLYSSNKMTNNKIIIINNCSFNCKVFLSALTPKSCHIMIYEMQLTGALLYTSNDGLCCECYGAGVAQRHHVNNVVYIFFMYLAYCACRLF